MGPLNGSDVANQGVPRQDSCRTPIKVRRFHGVLTKGTMPNDVAGGLWVRAVVVMFVVGAAGFSVVALDLSRKRQAP